MWMIFLAVFAGANIVLCRFLNAGSATRNGLSMSTLMNYITGLVTSLMVLWLTQEKGSFSQPSFSIAASFAYLGGAVGVITVLLSNYLTPRMPAFLQTLLIFISQLLTGLLLDYFLVGVFSPGKLVGGMLVLAGLWHYQVVHRRSDAKAAAEIEKETA